MVISTQKRSLKMFTFMGTCGDAYAPVHVLTEPHCLNAVSPAVCAVLTTLAIFLLHIVVILFGVLPLESH